WQSEWESVDWMGEVEQSLVGERAFFQQEIAILRRDPSHLDVLSVTSSTAASLKDVWEKIADDPRQALRNVGFTISWPYWWSYADELAGLRRLQECLEAVREMR